jgi:hypothetical protein
MAASSTASRSCGGSLSDARYFASAISASRKAGRSPTDACAMALRWSSGDKALSDDGVKTLSGSV